MEVSDIKKFVSELDDFNAVRIKNQKEDQTFYDDEFAVRIAKPFHIVRTGSAARVVDNIVAHLEVANPQVFREPRKTTAQSRESATKVGRFLNFLVQKMIPEIRESAYNAVLRGEGVFQLDFNRDAYDKKGKDYIHRPDESPVIVTSPDPMVVYCWPYDTLLPDKVVKTFSMSNSLAREYYPDVASTKSKISAYEAYFDDKIRHFELDGFLVESKKNIYGFCPFVHYYSGFGKRNAEGKPESLAVGRLRKLHGLLVEQCETVSRIDSIIGLYANPILLLAQTSLDAASGDENKLKEMILGPGQTHVIPYGWTATIYVPDVATAQLFAHLAQINQALGLENPPILSGIPANSRETGRQADIQFGHVERKYVTLMNNLEAALEAVLYRSLQIIDSVPQALPVTIKAEIMKEGEKIIEEQQITKEDIDGYYDCVVKLNPEASLEDDRSFMKWRILANEGRVSWKQMLINGCNMTEWEADETIAEALAEQTILNDPLMKAARAQEAIERMGMERYVKKAQEDGEMNRKMQENMKEYMAQGGGGQIRPSEARNPQAMDTVRQLLGGETPQGLRAPPTQGGI